ncbi:MAG: CDC48 family AAA ATPase, partial [Candidatus Aenigmatarchaeota archaeon]
GLGDAINKIREMVELPMRHPELFTKLGIEPPKGVLLYGPPGTGKTLLAKAVANESGANFYSIAGPEVMSKWYGESEANLRKIFEEAEKNAPSIIFIDEIDAIAPKREEVTGEVERRVVSQILTLMDGLKSRGKVIVIAATNRPNAIDPALRRPGRFDREIEIGVPDQKGRKEILQIHTRNMPIDRSTVDLDHLASITYGFVGADLEALCKEAAMSALRRNLPQISWKTMDELPPKVIEKLKVTKQDFDNALKIVEPSAMREVLVEVPKVKWDDVGGLKEVKQSLQEIVEWPLKHPESFERIGIRPPKGILLYGPPGSGKTLLARAVATESGANFISIKGPEVFSKWVGESEKHIRDIFRRARQVAPAVIFFDEIDALAPHRGLEVGTRVSENVVSQILTEMSGLEDIPNVVVIAATNRPDIIDPALLRPGRFDRQVLVPAPDEEARLEILKIHTKKMPLKGVDLKHIARETEGYSGADLEALVREAGLNALRKDFKAKYVTKKDFEEAMKKVKPSVTPELVKFYNKIAERLKAPPTEKGKDKVEYVG